MVYEAPIRLNLGCNINYLLGWINLDVNPQVKADVYADLNDGLPFPSDYATEILLSHVIEHLSYKSGKRLVTEIYRVLQKNGTFRISTPNLAYILEKFEEGKLESE